MVIDSSLDLCVCQSSLQHVPFKACAIQPHLLLKTFDTIYTYYLFALHLHSLYRCYPWKRSQHSVSTSNM